MALLKNRWTLNFDLPGVLFWCFISLIFPLAYGTLGPASLVKTGLFLVCSVCAGEVVLGSLPFMGRIPTLLRTGALMMMGTYILFLSLPFCLIPFSFMSCPETWRLYLSLKAGSAGLLTRGVLLR